MKLYGGMDLHSTNVVTQLIDEQKQGHLSKETRLRFRANSKRLGTVPK